MTVDQALDALLKSYTQYYDIKREDVTPPFAAEAEFHSHDEQFFLVKTAKLSEAEAHEYVFFGTADRLDAPDVEQMDAAAWDTGLSRVKPHAYHRSTDVVLVLLADTVTPETMSLVKRLRHYKSYRFTLNGWSHYRVIALETSTGKLACNRLGRPLRKLFRNIIKELADRTTVSGKKSLS